MISEYFNSQKIKKMNSWPPDFHFVIPGCWGDEKDLYLYSGFEIASPVKFNWEKDSRTRDIVLQTHIKTSPFVSGTWAVTTGTPFVPMAASLGHQSIVPANWHCNTGLAASDIKYPAHLSPFFPLIWHKEAPLPSVALKNGAMESWIRSCNTPSSMYKDLSFRRITFFDMAPGLHFSLTFVRDVMMTVSFCREIEIGV